MRSAVLYMKLNHFSGAKVSMDRAKCLTGQISSKRDSTAHEKDALKKKPKITGNYL